MHPVFMSARQARRVRYFENLARRRRNTAEKGDVTIALSAAEVTNSQSLAVEQGDNQDRGSPRTPKPTGDSGRAARDSQVQSQDCSMTAAFEATAARDENVGAVRLGGLSKLSALAQAFSPLRAPSRPPSVGQASSITTCATHETIQEPEGDRSFSPSIPEEPEPIIDDPELAKLFDSMCKLYRAKDVSSLPWPLPRDSFEYAAFTQNIHAATAVKEDKARRDRQVIYDLMKENKIQPIRTSFVLNGCNKGNRSAVLGQWTVWCVPGWTRTERCGSHVWPSPSAFLWEGDQRQYDTAKGEKFGRYLPLVKEHHIDNNTVSYEHLHVLKAFPLDSVRNIPGEDTIWGRGAATEIQAGDEADLLNSDLLAALDDVDI